MQMLENNYNEGTQRQQHDCSFAEEEQKKKEGDRLLYITVIWLCKLLQVNGNNSGIFMFISNRNGLI